MAIDPSISLQVQPFKAPDIMGAYQKRLSLENLLQQNELGQTEVERSQLQTEQMKQQATAQSKISQIFVEEGGDLAKAAFRVKAEVGPQAVPLLKPIIEIQERLNTLNDNSLKKLKEQVAELMQQAYPLLQMDDAQAAPAYAQLIQSNVASGKIPKELIDSGQISAEYPGKEKMQFRIMGTQTLLAQADLAIKKASEARAVAEEGRKQGEYQATLPGKTAQSQMLVAQNARGGVSADTQFQFQNKPMDENQALTLVSSGTPEEKGRAQAWLRAAAGQKGSEGAATIGAQTQAAIGGIGTGSGTGPTREEPLGTKHPEVLSKVPTAVANQVIAISKGRAVLPPASREIRRTTRSEI